MKDARIRTFTDRRRLLIADANRSIHKNTPQRNLRRSLYDPFILRVAETFHDSPNFSTLLLASRHLMRGWMHIMRKHIIRPAICSR